MMLDVMWDVAHRLETVGARERVLEPDESGSNV